MPSRQLVLVLWDVDHTLLSTGGLGRALTIGAYESVTGRHLETLPPAAGQTEPGIWAGVLAAHGLSADAYPFEAYARALSEGYLRRTAELRERTRALPGAAETLHTLSRRSGVRQTVVTGNTRPVAEAKLAAAGLADRLDLDAGGYGEQSRNRADLVRHALGRFGDALAVVVGDTPADVAAAHAAGVPAVAVASGRSSRTALAEAGADAVLPALDPVDVAVDTVLTAAGGRRG